MPKTQNTVLSAIPLSHPINKNIALELQLITPELAAAWLGDNHGNRNQRPRAIAAYTRDILNGEWLTTGESIKFDWNGRLIDGQHRLEAIVASRTAIMSVVVHGLDPRVQRVLDTNAKRTAADALRFAGVTVQPKDVASIARVAIAFESGKIRTALDQAKVDVTHAETIAWHDANPDVINAAALATRVARPIGATISGIGYAVLTLERIDGLAAVEFFTSMAEKRGLTGNGDPRKAMLDAFDSIRSHRRVPTAAESLAITFRAWNVWRADGSLKIIRAGASDGNGGITGVQIPEPK